MDKRISYIQVCNSHLTCMWERFLGAWAPPIPAAPTPTSTSSSSLHPQNQGKQGSRNTRCSQRRWVLLSESLWGTNVTAAEPKLLQAQDGLGAPGCPGALSTDPSKHASRRVCASLPIPLLLRTPYSLTLSRASASKVLIASFCNESPSWSRSWNTLHEGYRTSLPGYPVDPWTIATPSPPQCSSWIQSHPRVMYHFWLSILSPLAFVPAGQSPHKHPLSGPLWNLPDPPLLLRHVLILGNCSGSG